MYPRKYVLLYQFHRQKEAQLVSATFCISNVSPAVASFQRYIEYIFGIGQFPAIYQIHLWQRPLSNGISDTFLTVVIRHISNSGQCPTMYLSQFVQWPVASVVIKFLSQCNLLAAQEVPWLGCFHARTPTTALAKFSRSRLGGC